MTLNSCIFYVLLGIFCPQFYLILLALFLKPDIRQYPCFCFNTFLGCVPPQLTYSRRFDSFDHQEEPRSSLSFTVSVLMFSFLPPAPHHTVDTILCISAASPAVLSNSQPYSPEPYGRCSKYHSHR